MGFDELLDNRRLIENLTKSLARGRISHFYLISGPAGSGKHTLARLLASAILCQGQRKPCGVCGPCRKIKNGNHPDFITVEDPEHKNVAVKIVRQFREDVFIRPNESDHKIYLFPQELGLEGQNALLKILEEPPAYGVFILLTDNPERLLPTVRSRCTELALQPLEPELLRRTLNAQFPDASADAVTAAMERSGGYLGQAKALLEDGSAVTAQTEGFVRGFAGRSAMVLTETLVPMEKWKRDQLIPELRQWTAILESALTCRSGLPAINPMARTLSASRSSQELLNAIRSLQKACDYAQSNVSPAAICGWLAWALR
ncbi:MAG: DNA polymerase III subunit [Oscillospiraceae bacterium]|nr:DNA polymerase III subunit [Oscillospiraceae bacterium]